MSKQSNRPSWFNSRLGLIVFTAVLCGLPVLAQGGPPESGTPGPLPMQRRVQRPAFGMRRPQMNQGRPGRMGGQFQRQRRAGRGGLAMLRRPEVRREIGLSDDQIKKLDDIAFNAAKVRLEEQKNIQLRRLELNRLTRSENPDRSAIDKKMQEISQAQLAQARGATNAMLDGRAVLTTQQREKMAQFVERTRNARQGQRNGGDRQGGPQPGRPADPPQPPR